MQTNTELNKHRENSSFDIQSNIKKQQTELNWKPIKAEKMGNFSMLGNYAEQIKTREHNRQLRDDEQAWFKHELARVKYSISPKEIELLRKITGISFNNDISHGKALQEAIDGLEQKISDIEMHNGKMKNPFDRIFRKKRVSHLNAARNYLIYHNYKYKLNKAPEIRLNPANGEGKHRKHNEFNFLTTFRNKFATAVKSLFSFSAANRALKKLNKAFEEKNSQALDLKIKYAPGAKISEKKRSDKEKKEKLKKHTYKRNQKAFDDFKKNSPEERTFFSLGPLEKDIDQYSKNDNNTIKKVLINDNVDQFFTTNTQSYNEIFEAQTLIHNCQEKIKEKATEIGEETLDEDRQQQEEYNDLASVLQALKRIQQKIEETTFFSNSEKVRQTSELLKLLDDQIGIIGQQQSGKNKESLKPITLENVVELTYQQASNSATTLLDQCYFKDGENINRLHQPLNSIGSNISELKEAKKGFQLDANAHYQSLMTLLIAKKEAYTFLSNLTKDNFKEKLRPEIDKLTNILETLKVDSETVVRLDVDLLIYLKSNMLLNYYKGTLNQCDTTDADIPKIISTQKEMLSKEISKVEAEAKWRKSRTTALINTANKTTKAFIYYADHATVLIEGDYGNNRNGNNRM